MTMRTDDFLTGIHEITSEPEAYSDGHDDELGRLAAERIAAAVRERFPQVTVHIIHGNAGRCLDLVTWWLDEGVRTGIPRWLALAEEAIRDASAGQR